MFVQAIPYFRVSNQYVYIKNDLELNAATSNFYLRKGGQLLEVTTGSGANKGIRSLSVFQEGSVNNFQYNYWCSSVGNVEQCTAVNNPFGISQLGRPTKATATLPAAILASNSYDGTASPLAIVPYWLYKFGNKTSYSDWVQLGLASTLTTAEGFTMKGSSSKIANRKSFGTGHPT